MTNEEYKARLQSAVAHYKAKEYDAAIADCDEALSQDPNNTSVYYNRSLAYYCKGEYGRAIADLEAALKLAPDNSRYLEMLNKARAAAERKKSAAAARDAGKTEKRTTDSGVFARMQSERQRQIGNAGQSGGNSREEEAPPQDAAACFQDAVEHAARGDFERAGEEINEAIHSRPNDAQAYFQKRATADTDATQKAGEIDGGIQSTRGRDEVVRRVKKRGLASLIIFSIITAGIYVWFWVHSLAKDVNAICEGDGKRTGGFLKWWLFGLLTFGIYNFVWLYMLGDRLQDNAAKYGLSFKEGGGTVLLWFLLGLLIVIGPFIAMHIIIKNTNALADQYNKRFASSAYTKEA